MSQSRARAARRQPPNGHHPDEPTDAVEAAVESSDEQQPQGMAYPAILVVRIPGEQPGQERIEFQELNGIDPLSVPTVLRLAANVKDAQLGLHERK